MIILTGASDILRIVTTAAVALDAHVSFVDTDANNFTPNRQNTTVSTATTTTVASAVGAGLQRGVKHARFHARGGANTVTVEYFDGSTAFRLASVALATGETLEYEDANGWRVHNALGEQKIVQTIQLPTLQSHLSWAPNAAGQASNVLTLQPAGHTPGLYLVTPHVLVRTLQATSYLTMNITFSNAGNLFYIPTNAGAGSALSITALGVSGNNGTTTIPRTPYVFPIYSDGISALTAQFSAAGTMGGAALLDCYASAFLLSR